MPSIRTPRRTRIDRALTWGIALGSSLTLLTACSSGTDAPDDATTPQVDAVALEKQHVTDAQKAYENYTTTYNAVQASGWTDWEMKILPLVGSGQLKDSLSNSATAVAEGAMSVEGEATTVSVELDEYVADPDGDGTEQVKLNACRDYAGVTIVTGGERAPSTMGRVLVSVLMQHQADGRWTVDADDPQVGTTC